MFLTEQPYLLKESAGSTKTHECNTSSDIYMKSLTDYIEYPKEEEKKIKTFIIQSLVSQNRSSAPRIKIMMTALLLVIPKTWFILI